MDGQVFTMFNLRNTNVLASAVFLCSKNTLDVSDGSTRMLSGFLVDVVKNNVLNVGSQQFSNNLLFCFPVVD